MHQASSSISLASLFTSLSIFGWSDLLQILRIQAAVLCIIMFPSGRVDFIVWLSKLWSFISRQNMFLFCVWTGSFKSLYLNEFFQSHENLPFALWRHLPPKKRYIENTKTILLFGIGIKSAILGKMWAPSDKTSKRSFKGAASSALLVQSARC